MHRTRIAVATAMVAAGLVGAIAAPASAEAPDNYGFCVAFLSTEPSVGDAGPWNLNAAVQAASHAYLKSGNNSHFENGSIACARP